MELTLKMSTFCMIDDHIRCPETRIICLMEKPATRSLGQDKELVETITSMMSDVSWTWTYNLTEPGWITADCCITPEGGYKWTMEAILARNLVGVQERGGSWLRIVSAPLSIPEIDK